MHPNVDYSIKKIYHYLSSNYKGTGWGYTDSNQQVFVEPSCWCINFLNFSDMGQELILSSLDWLNDIENPDGGWPNFGYGPSDIRTANVLFTINYINLDHPILQKKDLAADWLINHQKKTGGWSWNRNSWNFTEPTCMAILALLANLDSPTGKNPLSKYFYLINMNVCEKDEKFNAKYKIELATVRKFMEGLQCFDGGWNSHSPISLGHHQTSMTSVSPWAIIALGFTGEVIASLYMQKSIQYLLDHEQDYWHSPYSLGSILLSLASSGSFGMTIAKHSNRR